MTNTSRLLMVTLINLFLANDKTDIFITVPRFQAGVPATLTKITDKTYNNHTVLAPYPDWSWFESPEECRLNRIVSSYRVKVN